jgi:hypothetical protein
MVFNATFNNVSVISWQAVLLVEKTGDPADCEMYSIQHYVIKCVSNLQQVAGFYTGFLYQ